MTYIDFMSVVHKSTKRDYLARVNDPDYPKAKAGKLAKKWGHDYWDGDRRINYGGYHYLPGRWAPVGQAMIDHYGVDYMVKHYQMDGEQKARTDIQKAAAKTTEKVDVRGTGKNAKMVRIADLSQRELRSTLESLSVDELNKLNEQVNR